MSQTYICPNCGAESENGGIIMNEITKEQYEYALAKIEDLLPLVTDETSAIDGNALELSIMSETVIAYEKKHYPIGKHRKVQSVPVTLDMHEVAVL